MLHILGKGGSLPINDKVINDMASGNLTAAASWIVMLAVVAVFGARTWLRESRRRSSGLVAPPASLTLLKIGGALVAGVVVVLICNTNRGRLIPIRGPAMGRAHRPRRAGHVDRCCWVAPSSAATCMPSVATPRRPGGRASTWR